MQLLDILIIFFILNLFIFINFHKINLFKFALDKPDKLRKFHKKNTPLAGGIILFINIFIYFTLLNFNKDIFSAEIFFYNFSDLNYFIFTCCLIFLIGIIDDKIDLNASKKFSLLIIVLIQFIFLSNDTLIRSINLSFLDNTFYLGKYSFLFTLFCFLVFLNAFNMFDGINLQSSSYSLIILIFFSYLKPESILVIILIIFILFFMGLNFLNKSFLGDSGSLLISFILSFIFIKLFNNQIILNSDEILIYMLIPGIDMIRLFFERIKNNKNPFSNDRLHLHHLLLIKFSYLKTIFIINLLIILPILANHVGISKLKIIIITISIYFLSIWKIKKIN